ncbi:MAG: rhodanese-like domain-containing protein [Verrucomicrobiales bacterium]
MKKLIAALIGLASMVTAAVGAEEYGDIELKDLKEAIAEKKVVLIDVNGKKSYDSGHIPTAIEYTAVKGKLGEVLPEEKDTLIVAYCGSPKCSAYKMAAKEAVALGYTNVKHFSDGISGWLKAGEPTEKAE